MGKEKGQKGIRLFALSLLTAERAEIAESIDSKDKIQQNISFPVR